MPVKLQPRKRTRKSIFRSKTAIFTLAVLAIVVCAISYAVFAPRPVFHDVSIIGVEPSSAAVPLGLDIEFNVTVENQGTFSETFDVNATVPTNSSTRLYSQNVGNLPAKTRRMLTFVWSTSGLALGDYRLNVTASPVANETDAADNSFSTVLTLSNRVLLTTSMGNFTIELFDDMPITTGNFKKLVWQGMYDGTIFHRVVHDFVVQGGNLGNNVANITDELPNKHSNIAGAVAMAKTGEANSATSQFFINLKNNSETLDAEYSVFGRVTAGMDVVLAIGEVPTDTDRPLQDVTLIKAQFTR